jgi:Holliday junction resolvase RusA-like endonuclease
MISLKSSCRPAPIDTPPLESEIVVDEHGVEWRKAVEFFASGIPRPGGSKRAALIPKRGGGFATAANGRPIIGVREDCERNRDWRAVVAHEAAVVCCGLLDGELSLCVDFVMQRPRAHYRRNGQLKTNAPKFHTVKPDATKLTRALEDALTGIVWTDDARICDQRIRKPYGDRPGAKVIVYVMVADSEEMTVAAPTAGELFGTEGQP